jgi:hypothetical protein
MADSPPGSPLSFIPSLCRPTTVLRRPSSLQRHQRVRLSMSLAFETTGDGEQDGWNVESALEVKLGIDW